MAKASEDILYEAYKQGKVKINDLNEEGKRAIYNKLFDSSKVVSPNAPMARIPKQTETPPASFAMPVVSPTVPTVQKPVSYVEALRDNGSWARDMAGVSPSEAFTQKQPAGLPTQRPTQPSWAQVIGHTINAGSGDYLSSLANAPKTVLQALPGVNPKEDYVVRFLDGVVKHFEDDSAYSQDQLGELSGAKKFVNVGGRALPQIVGSAMMAYGTGGANLAGMGIKQMLPFGASAAGSYARQAELEGADYTQQVLYGITGGAAEMATEMPIFKGMLKTIKGIGALPKVELGARNLIGKYGKIGLDWVKNSVKEAAQEAIIEPITGMAKKAIYDQDMPMYGEGGVVNPDAVAEAGYSGLAMSVLLGGLALPGTLAHQKISNAIETNRTIDGNFIEEVARDMRGEEEAAKASLPQNQEMNSVASAIPNIEPTVPNFETAAPMTEEMAVPEQIMSPSIARTYGGMYRQTAGQPITSSIEQTTTQPIVQQSEPSPMSMVGQKFTLQQFGPVEVVDDSDASKLKLKTASGAELDIGRKAFQNLLIPEAPVVQTAQQVEGLSAPLATLPHDGLEIAPEGKRSQGDVKGALAGQNESQGADLPDDLANNIKLMNDAAEKLGLANEKENKTDTGKHGVSGGVDQKNIGYHAGDLGKADFLASMPGRGTGHFGTGTYFFGSEEAPGYEDYAKKRPVHKVSFEGYNLYKPENLSQGRRLHDLLKNVNKFAFGSSRYRDNLKDIISEAKLLFPDIKANYIVQEIRNLRKYVKENIDKDNTARFEKTKRYDSPSTVFMKNLGYQGVDVRGIKGLDDSEFGSVIYELRNIKPEDSKTEVEGIAEDGQNSQQREKIKPILDKNGKPLVVYHGTNAEFDIFDKTKNQQKTLYGPAFYFTDSKSEGNKYATTYRVGGTPRIIAANLYANNIFDYNNDKLTPEQVERLGWDEWIHITEPTRIGQMDAVVSDWVSSGLQELGYDACKITEKNGSSTYAVFEPNQIKIVPSEQPQQSIQEQVASLAPAIPIGQPKNILKDYQMTLIHTKTKGGTPVWNLAGNTKPFSSWLGKGGAGGTWYGPKKVWSFYGEEDPTEKILKALPPKPVQGETQEQFVDRIVGGIAEKAKDVPRDELKTTILRNLPPSISIAEGEKWIESNLLKTEITQSKPESLMDKAKKVGVAISKDYKKGDRVTWKDRNGKELSGTVQRDPFADDVYISVDTDQIAHAGGVPIGRIEMVWLTNPSLKKIESQSAQEPEEPSQKTPEVVKSTQQEPGIKEAVTNDNAGEDKPRDVRQNGVGTPGETPPADGEGIAPEGEPAGSSTGDGTELQGSNTTTRGTTGKSESPSGKSDLSGESTTSELDQADSVGNAERPTPATRRRDSSQSKRNHRITADDEIGVGGPKAKFRASVEAIKLVKQLEAEGRLATPEEQQTLAKFTGWGPLRQAFEFKRGRWIPGKGYEQEALYPEWTNEFKEMKELLSEQEYSFASNAIQDAFYTSPEVVGAMYETVKRFGFEGGRILEPSMGAGYFFGSMPDNIMNNSKLVGVELDTITGAIAKQLYQKADIRVQGFQETTFPDNFFDLAISNVPFGKIMIHDPAYKEKFKTSRIHNYFFVKALDKVRPGGIVAFITSSGTMNSQDANAMALRHYLSGKADLLGAIRLPGDAFKKLGTQVTTDIIFLRKRKEGERPSGENWLATEDIQVRDKNGNLVELANNEYYQKHPEMMLGEIVPDKLFQNRLGLKAKEGDFEADLKEAVNKLPENIFTKEKIKATEELTPQETVANLHEIKNYSFFMQNGGLFQRQGGVAIPLKISGKAGARMKAFIELREATKDVLATQQLDKSETEIKAAQKKLTTLYDRFVKT
jgi:hypothetical protein